MVPDVEAEARAHCAAHRWHEATVAALRGYGPELIDYLIAIARSETDGGDAFAQFSIDLWRGLPTFRWDASLRTWCYTLARHALARLQRAPARRREVALDSVLVEQVAAQIRTRTVEHLRTAVKDRVRELRHRLSPDEQTILVLRIDRDLPWRDIARIVTDEGEPLTEADLVRRAAALRKRFESIKHDLRALAQAEGLGSRE